MHEFATLHICLVGGQWSIGGIFPSRGVPYLSILRIRMIAKLLVAGWLINHWIYYINTFGEMINYKDLTATSLECLLGGYCNCP